MNNRQKKFKALNPWIFGIFALCALHMGSAYAGFCGDVSEEVAQTKVTNFVRDLKIAKSRGDAETMQKGFDATYRNYLAKSCSAVERDRICGFDCQKQIAEYYYFQANDISYYLSAQSTVIQKPENLVKVALEGVAYVTERIEAASAETPTDFRDYLFKGGQLQLMKVKLHITAGDISYQQASDARLQRLRFLMSATTGSRDDKGQIAQAKAFYEKASWDLQASSLEIPQENPLFSSLAVEVLTLENELKQRLDSINKGMLFLNIDPEEFSQLPMVKLQSELEDITGKLIRVEENITALRTDWSNAKVNTSVETINQELRSRETSISQSAYRIAQLEGIAQNMEIDLEKKLNEIGVQQESLAFEEKKFDNEFQLKMKLNELNSRKNVVQKQGEIELLQIDKAKTERQLNDLRWYMDWQVAMTNLKIQLSQLESEADQFKSQLDINILRKAQTNNRVIANNLQIDSSKTIKAQSINDETNLRSEKNEIGQAQLLALEAQLCSTRIRLNHLGKLSQDAEFKVFDCKLPAPLLSSTEYFQQMCGSNGLRGKFDRNTIKTIGDALCVIGPEPGLPAEILSDAEAVKALNNCSHSVRIHGTERDLALKIMQKEMQMAEAEISATEKSRDLMIAAIARVLLQDLSINGSRLGFEIAISAFESTAQSLALIPETTTCICGVSSGAMTRISPADAAKAVAEAARAKLDRYVSWAQYLKENESELRQMATTLKEYQDSLENQRYGLELKKLHSMRALTEITGRALNTQNSLVEAMITRGINVLTCDKDISEMDENAANLSAEHSRLQAEIAALSFRNQNLDLSIANEKLKREREDNTIAALTIENQNLAIDNKAIDRENKTLDTLLGKVGERSDMLKKLETEVTQLADESKVLSSAIEQIETLHADKVTKLSQDDVDVIKGVISNEETFSRKMGTFIDKAAGLAHINSDLRTELNAFKASIQTSIETERSGIIATVNAQVKALSSGRKEQVFLASQEEMAEFEKGVPAFIEEKRSLLKRANRFLILLRNQIHSIAALRGGSPLSLSRSDALVTVKNSDDLSRLQKVIQEPLWQPGQQITTKTIPIRIPYGSALARELSTQQRASFEISPFARQQMDKLGYYSLWDSAFDAGLGGLNQNLLLIDVNLVVDITGCSRINTKRFVINHKGQGLVFRETSAGGPMLPQLVVSASRKYSPSYYPTADTVIADIVRFWSLNFTVNTFGEQEIPNFPGRSMLPPLMGLPLIGQYEVVLDPPSETCSYENANFDFYFTYAVQQRP